MRLVNSLLSYFWKPRLRYVAGVSWPRSGHHLLVRFFDSYFGRRFLYCDFYPPETDCCRSFPCKWQDRITFSKNHDFELGITRTADVPYLVQYRTFWPSVVSNYELFLLAGQEDSKELFQLFARDRLPAYLGFHEKWIEQPEPERMLIIKYEDLVADPFQHLVSVVRYCSPTEFVNLNRIAATIASIAAQTIIDRRDVILPEAGIVSPRKVEKFRYYDADFFAALERQLPHDGRSAAE